MDAKFLGPVIQAWRIEAGLTQQELADRAGLKKRVVGSIERGTRDLTKQEIVQICLPLGKAPGELITIWYRAWLAELNEAGKLHGRGRSSPADERSPEESPDSGAKVNQIIDKMAALAKELYRESKTELRATVFDWLTQTGPAGSVPSAPPPERPRRRVGRKRGPGKT
jgi:transcriptional regulator with XRE-family HTH domain